MFDVEVAAFVLPDKAVVVEGEVQFEGRICAGAVLLVQVEVELEELLEQEVGANEPAVSEDNLDSYGRGTHS